MMKDVYLILLIVFGISLLLVVECVSYIDVFDRLDTLPEGLRQIAATARDDAKIDVGTATRVDVCLWLSGGFCLGISGGCLLGALGIVGAYYYQPSPPPTRLLGKSPEYVDFYVSYYKSTRNRVALSGACLGCAAGSVVAALPRTPWAIPFGFFAGRMATERGW